MKKFKVPCGQDSAKLKSPTVSQVKESIVSNQVSNQPTKENKMTITSMVGKKISKNVKFMNEDVKIFKLSVSEVLAIQEEAKIAEKDEKQGFSVLKTVIRSGVEDGNQLTDEQFDGFPMDELSKLSSAIMSYSGLGAEAGK